MVNIFVSYSHRDHRWFVEDSPYDLIPWLRNSLKRDNVRLWYDRSDQGGLQPGDEFRREIERQIDGAQIALLLLSEAFFSSDFIQTVEVPRIMARAERKEMVVIPVLLEPCDWDDFEYVASRQMVPGKPTPLINYTKELSDWVNARHEILTAIRRRIAQVIKDVEAAPPAPPPVAAPERPAAKALAPPVIEAPGVQPRRPRWMLVGIGLALLVVIVGIWLVARTLTTGIGQAPLPTATIQVAPTATGAPALKLPTATLTATSLTPTPTPGVTAFPTATATSLPLSPTSIPPTATALLPSPTPIPPTATLTPAPQAVVNVAQANVRSGPGTEYPIIATYPQGADLRPVGRNRSGTWLVVRGPDGSSEGWMAVSTLRLTGDIMGLPEVAAPPTPTPTVTPLPTATPPATPTFTPEPPTSAPAPRPTATPAPAEEPTPAPP